LKKKKVLFQSEASFLSTGFSTMMMEIMKRLHKDGSIDFVEFGSYAKTSDPRAGSLPWKFYGAVPEDHDEFGKKRYSSSIYSQFGQAMFEQVLLQEQPDIVFSNTDHWMLQYQMYSPLRDNYKLMWCPTVDGRPQKIEWIEDYGKADLLLTYCDWASKVLWEESGGKIKSFGSVRPGCDHKVFRPMNAKKELRQKYGVPEDSYVITTVMRNQKRKLYPDLIKSFAELIKHCVKEGNKELAEKTYLYIHSSYPDVGYDLADLVMKHGVAHRVFFSYTCVACKSTYSSFFSGELACCKKCGKHAAHMPNTGHGVSRETLAEVYNMADVYVQYAVSEGYSLTCSEAKACGTPVFAVDYSAMEDHAYSPGGMPIKVQRFLSETVTETEQDRVLPDNDDLVKKLYDFFTTLSPEGRISLGNAARKRAETEECFDRSYKIVLDAINSIDVPDHSLTWQYPILRSFSPSTKVPPNLNNGQFVDWCIDNILHEPNRKKSWWRDNVVKGLNCGYIVIGHQQARQKFDRQDAGQMMLNMANEKLFWENQRYSKFFGVKEEKIWHEL
jgi:glycosyltransferase involved in cell wall biosynthesis